MSMAAYRGRHGLSLKADESPGAVIDKGESSDLFEVSVISIGATRAA